PREVAHEAAGERVARAGRVEHVLERVRRDIEGAARLDQERAVLPLLDDHPARPMRHDSLAGAVDVPVAGEITRLAVVDQQLIRVAQAHSCLINTTSHTWRSSATSTLK